MKNTLFVILLSLSLSACEGESVDITVNKSSGDKIYTVKCFMPDGGVYKTEKAEDAWIGAYGIAYFKDKDKKLSIETTLPCTISEPLKER